MKCDETYPACNRCISTGRTCDGCTQRSDEWEIVTIPSVSPGLGRRPSPSKYDGKAEASFTFFQRRTADYLAGLFDRQWKELVLRAAEQNDAIYHAVLAIGSMHKSFMSRQWLNIEEEDTYAVKQYSRSLRTLASKRSATVDTVLAACIIYIGFEVCRISKLPSFDAHLRSLDPPSKHWSCCGSHKKWSSYPPTTPEEFVMHRRQQGYPTEALHVGVRSLGETAPRNVRRTYSVHPALSSGSSSHWILRVFKNRPTAGASIFESQ